MLPSSHTAAELMELRQPETLCVLDHDDGRIGHVDPYFHDRGGHKDLDLIFPKGFHDRILFLLFHFSVKAADPDIVSHLFCKHLGVVHDILCLKALALFHHRTDHIALPALCHLPSHE